MINAVMVNAGVSGFFRAILGEFHRFLGRIPRLKKPFKYKRRFEINQKTRPAGEKTFAISA